MSLSFRRPLAGAVITLLAALLPASILAQSPPPAPPDSAKAAESKYVKGTLPVKPKITPQHIEVQHILIAFDGSLPGREVGRTREEAKKLAYEILEMARMGADYDTLVKQWTSDSYPGIYRMANTGITVRDKEEFARGRMVPAFGNVGFEISPGNIGIADWDPKASPYGWHIIKRLK
jgi:hypothetical protein